MKKIRQAIAADAIEAAQYREAAQRRQEQARQGLDTGERKEYRADDLSARLRAIHSLSPNTRERQRIAAHDRVRRFEHQRLQIQLALPHATPIRRPRQWVGGCEMLTFIANVAERRGGGASCEGKSNGTQGILPHEPAPGFLCICPVRIYRKWRAAAAHIIKEIA